MRKPLPIGLWTPRDEAGETVWERPAPGPLGDHWATRRVLRRKQSELPLRTVLLGESVAAGYLYAPRLTPATILEAQLQGIGGGDRFEVIDLARTNETLAGLAATARAALQILPDVLVLWAGNNWDLLETPEISSCAGDPGALRAFGTALRAEGLAGPQRLARQRLRERAAAVFAEIDLLARTVGIPVIVVVPETNLGAWDNQQPVAWLPADGVERWHRHYRAAVAALAGGRWEAAVAAARMALALDGGNCPTAWGLLARALAGSGDTAGAATAARSSVAALRGATMGFLGAPQADAEVQQLIRELGGGYPFFLIDLPAVFAEYTGDPLPGGRLFLDYCHHTAEGMRVAMAAVAARVLDLSGLVAAPPPWREVLTRAPGPPPPPEVEAVACLGAALHGGHRLAAFGSVRSTAFGSVGTPDLGVEQPPSFHSQGPAASGSERTPAFDGKTARLADHCRRALAVSPGVERAMLDVVAARCAPAPAVLSAAQQRNAHSPWPLLPQHGWHWDHHDADLLAAIRSSLPDRVGEIDFLLAALAVGPEGVELSRPPYPALWEPLERFYYEHLDRIDLTPPAFLRCPWPETSFAVVVATEDDLEVDMTVRLPPPPGADSRNGKVTATLGGRAVATLAVAERWTRGTLVVPGELLRRGVNRLTLEWPLPLEVVGEPFAAALERLDAGLAADLHPVFGEVFSLLVRPAVTSP